MEDNGHSRNSGWKKNCFWTTVGGFGTLMFLFLFAFLWLLLGPGKIVLVNNKLEVVEVCNKPIKLTFEGTGGSQCKWLHYGTWQDKPCCYHDPREGLAGKTVCSLNVASPDDKHACRAGSKKNLVLPKVTLVGNNCTISIRHPKPQDVGRYEGYMPHKSKHPKLSKSIQYHDICDYTYHLSCYWFLYLFIFCAGVLLTVVVLVKCKSFPVQQVSQLSPNSSQQNLELPLYSGGQLANG